MTKKKMEARDKKANARAKERWGPGRTGRPHYRLKPRFSGYQSVNLESEEDAQKFIAEEKAMYKRACDEKLGPGMSEVGRLLGLRGVCEKITLCAHGWLVEDLIETEVRYMQPAFGTELCGLWELIRDFENPDADRRVKDNWLSLPIWKKGMRFVLRRNDIALDGLISMAKEAGANLDEQHMIEQAGYLVRSARGRWRHHEGRLDRFPHEFGMCLRPVPIKSAREAIDLVGPDDYSLKEVLIHLVDDQHYTTPWKFATLLEQSYHGEGPFEQDNPDAQVDD